MSKGLFQQYEFPIYPQEIDARQNLRLTSLCNYILNTAGYAAIENGFGSLEMIERGMTWVLSRLAIEMTELPKQYEHLCIKTWVEDYGRLFTTRHYQLFNHEGKIIGNATSLWAMIDVKTRKPINLQSMPEFNQFATGKKGEIDPAKKIRINNCEKISSHTSSYSDIDFNNHVNSVKYIEWMLDSYHASEKLYERNMKRVEINYLHESIFGEQIDICSEETEDRVVFALKNAAGVNLCNAEIIWG